MKLYHTKERKKNWADRALILMKRINGRDHVMKEKKDQKEIRDLYDDLLHTVVHMNVLWTI